MPSSLSWTFVVGVSVALAGCDVVAEPDGPRREDFVRSRSGVAVPAEDRATPDATEGNEPLSDVDGLESDPESESGWSADADFRRAAATYGVR